MTPDAENIHEQPDLLEERLSAYLDDKLDAGERAQLEAHLATCDTCQQQLAELRQVRRLMRALPQPALPRSFLLPVEEVSVPATPAASHASPIPLRSTTRRQRVARMARAAQWLGTIAAVLGLAILISTAVLGARGGTQASNSAATSGGATSAQSPAYSDQNAATATKAASTITAAGVPEVTTGQHDSKTAGGAQGPTATAQPPFLNLQLGGGGLLVAGVLLVIVSIIARRRNRVSQPAPPATGN